MMQLRVLIIGASGVFGSRLAELLANEPGVEIVLGGRRRKNLELLAEKLAAPCRIAVLDRDMLTGSDIAELNCQLVIDAAGPFQASHTRVIEAAIAASVHYLDLADGREFAKEIGQFDLPAREVGIAVITGASSIPALSHAVIEEITRGWSACHSITVGIFPGNRAPRGLAVVEAILSYVGKPVQVFRQGKWQHVPGWGMTHRMHVPFVGKRWASVCDTPDQDLLVARYRPTHSAEFFAGLELSILHLGLWLLSLPVRWGWIGSLLPFARPMLRIAQLLLPFGTDKGGMVIRVDGLDATGQSVAAEWALEANSNRGPYVPVLATLAMARKFRDGDMAFRGACPCVGLLSTSDFTSDFDRLGMKTARQPR